MESVGEVSAPKRLLTSVSHYKRMLFVREDSIYQHCMYSTRVSSEL